MVMVRIYVMPSGRNRHFEAACMHLLAGNENGHGDEGEQEEEQEGFGLTASQVNIFPFSPLGSGSRIELMHPQEISRTVVVVFLRSVFDSDLNAMLCTRASANASLLAPVLRAAGIMTQHRACQLYNSKGNIGFAQLIKSMAIDCVHRQNPRIPFLELIKREEHVSRVTLTSSCCHA